MHRLCNLLTAASLLIGPFQLMAQSDSRVAWLREHAIAVRSIDPADQDFTDLDGLRSKLAGVRIVLLGEATHGDGATFLAKTRLVEFLHREMGFDALIFESGFYDCWKAADMLTRGADARRSFQRCVWPMWSARQELDALQDYVERARAGGAPLAVLGLDPDFVMEPSRDYLAAELRVAVAAAGLAADAAVSELLSLVDSLYAYLDRRSPRPSSEAVERFISTAQAVAQEMDTVSAPASVDRTYWVRVLENLVSHVRFRLRPAGQPPSRESIEMRDEQMARNLDWLMREGLPGARVIVWTATLHAARNLSALTVLQDTQAGPWGLSLQDLQDLQEMYRTKQVMGDYLRQEYGDRMYAIGFTALGGTTAAGGLSGTPIGPPSDGSLEDLLGRAGFQYAYLNLRNLSTGGTWLSRELTARPLGYGEMRAKWSAVLDGVFFIRTMTPSTRAANR